MSADWIGSIFQAGAQDRATEQNAKNVSDTNRINLILASMARGAPLTDAQAAALGIPQLAGKSSAILPYYLSDIEKSTGMNAGALTMAIQNYGGTPAQQLAKAKASVDQFRPAQVQANQLGEDILSGATTRQMLSEQAPVSAATMGVATGERDAALQALDQTLNDIDNIQARKGYSGDSYGNRLLKATARSSIMGGAARDIGQAKLANARAVQGSQEKGRALQLNNLDLPGKMAASEAQFENLPSAIVAQRFGTSMSPLGYFNIGNHPFQQQNLPLVDYTSKAGLALSGLGSNAGSALNYALRRNLANQYNSTDAPTLTQSDLTPVTYGQYQNDISGANTYDQIGRAHV